MQVISNKSHTPSRQPSNSAANATQPSQNEYWRVLHPSCKIVIATLLSSRPQIKVLEIHSLEHFLPQTFALMHLSCSQYPLLMYRPRPSVLEVLLPMCTWTLNLGKPPNPDFCKPSTLNLRHLCMSLHTLV